jgi:hypothetical protein
MTEEIEEIIGAGTPEQATSAAQDDRSEIQVPPVNQPTGGEGIPDSPTPKPQQ